MPSPTASQKFTNYWQNWHWAGGAVKSIANLSIVTILVMFIGPETARRPFTITVSAGVAVICSFVVFIYMSGQNRKEKLIRLKQFAIAFVATGVVYAIVYSLLTGVDMSGDRYVKGFAYTDRIQMFNQQSADKGEPRLTDDAMVEICENNPRKVWVPATIDISAFVAHSLWFVLVFNTTLVLSMVMLLLPILTDTTVSPRNSVPLPNSQTPKPT